MIVFIFLQIIVYIIYLKCDSSYICRLWRYFLTLTLALPVVILGGADAVIITIWRVVIMSARISFVLLEC